MKIGKFGVRIVAVIILSTLISCGGGGSGTNNDQGVTFTFTGWYNEAPASGSTTLPQGISIVSIPFDPQPEATDEDEDQAGFFAGGFYAYAGVQNNLTGQFIRVRRLFHSFYIQGAEVQPPSTSVAAGNVVGPSVVTGGNAEQPFDSSLPPAFAADEATPGNASFQGLPLVPTEIVEWVNLNRSRLPDPPFSMVVTSYINGITSAGDSVDTNEVDITVIFRHDTEVNTVEFDPSDD